MPDDLLEADLDSNLEEYLVSIAVAAEGVVNGAAGSVKSLRR